MSATLAPTGLLADMDAPTRNFTIALGVSLFLHAVLLSIHFQFPGALSRAKEQALDVILVNSKSARKPEGAQARAQANLDGGGNTDENRRARTPLPPSVQMREGTDLVEAHRRVAELEARQQAIMTQARSDMRVASERERRNELATLSNVTGHDLANQALAIARLEGEINRSIEEYNKRPRKKFIGARTEEFRFAQYVEDWRQKVERIGNLNYPESARGRLYGSLVLTVVIRPDGHLERVEINRPSGHKLLDDAARRIVQMASPYAPFPADIARDTDILEITRTWTFTNADRLQTN